MSLRGMGIDNWEDPRISGEISFLESLSRRVAKPVVFDVGANVGQYAQLVMQAMPDAKLFSFEPHPTSFKALESAAANGKFEVRQLALSDSVGESLLFDHAAGAAGSQHATLFRDVIEVSYADRAESFPVNVVTLDTFLQKEGIPHIHLLKIDVEGAERNVLVGARETLEAGRIDVIQFEYTAANVATRVFMKDFVELLKGYSFYRMLPDGLATLHTYNAAVFEICGYQNIVAVREGSGIRF